MKGFLLRKQSGEYWGVNTSYKNAVVFLNEADAYRAWQNITTEPLEIVEVNLTEGTKLLKIWDEEDRGSGAV